MGQVRKTIDGSREIEFPDTMSEADIDAEMAKLNAQIPVKAGGSSFLGNVLQQQKGYWGNLLQGLKENRGFPATEIAKQLVTPEDKAYPYVMGPARVIEKYATPQNIAMAPGIAALAATPAAPLVFPLLAAPPIIESINRIPEISQIQDPVERRTQQVEAAADIGAQTVPWAASRFMTRPAAPPRPVRSMPVPPVALPPGPPGLPPAPAPAPAPVVPGPAQLPLKPVPRPPVSPTQPPPPLGPFPVEEPLGARIPPRDLPPDQRRIVPVAAPPEGLPPLTPPGEPPPPGSPEDAIRQRLIDQGIDVPPDVPITVGIGGGTRRRIKDTGPLTLDMINEARIAQGLPPLSETDATAPIQRQFRGDLPEEEISPPTPAAPLPTPFRPGMGPSPQQAPMVPMSRMLPPAPPPPPAPPFQRMTGPGPSGAIPPPEQQVYPRLPPPFQRMTGPGPQQPIPPPERQVYPSPPPPAPPPPAAIPTRPQVIETGKRKRRFDPYRSFEDAIAAAGGIDAKEAAAYKGELEGLSRGQRMKLIRKKGGWGLDTIYVSLEESGYPVSQVADQLNMNTSDVVIQALTDANFRKRHLPGRLDRQAAAMEMYEAGQIPGEEKAVLEMELDRLRQENEELKRRGGEREPGEEEDISFDFGEEPPTGGGGSVGGMQVGPVQKALGLGEKAPAEPEKGRLALPPQKKIPAASVKPVKQKDLFAAPARPELPAPLGPPAAPPAPAPTPKADTRREQLHKKIKGLDAQIAFTNRRLEQVRAGKQTDWAKDRITKLEADNVKIFDELEKAATELEELRIKGETPPPMMDLFAGKEKTPAPQPIPEEIPPWEPPVRPPKAKQVGLYEKPEALRQEKAAATQEAIQVYQKDGDVHRARLALEKLEWSDTDIDELLAQADKVRRLSFVKPQPHKAPPPPTPPGQAPPGPPPWKDYGGPGPFEPGPPLSKVKRPPPTPPEPPGKPIDMALNKRIAKIDDEIYALGEEMEGKPNPRSYLNRIGKLKDERLKLVRIREGKPPEPPGFNEPPEPKPEPEPKSFLDPLTKLAADIEQLGASQKATSKEAYQQQILKAGGKGKMSPRELLGLDKPKKQKEAGPLFKEEPPPGLFGPEPTGGAKPKRADQLAVGDRIFTTEYGYQTVEKVYPKDPRYPNAVRVDLSRELNKQFDADKVLNVESKSLGAADIGERKPHQKELPFFEKKPDLSEFHKRQREIIQKRSMDELVKINESLHKTGEISAEDTERAAELSRRWRMATGKNPDSTEVLKEFSQALRGRLSHWLDEPDLLRDILQGRNVGFERRAEQHPFEPPEKRKGERRESRRITVPPFKLITERIEGKKPSAPGQVKPFKKKPPEEEGPGPGSLGAAGAL